MSSIPAENNPAADPLVGVVTSDPMSPRGRQKRQQQFDINLYAMKKSAAQGMLDLALLMANAAQLKHIMLTGTDHRFYVVMMILLSTSIFLQIIVGIGLLVLAKVRITLEMLNEEKNDDDYKYRLRWVDVLNNLIVIGIFVLTVINVFISAFGLNETAPKTTQ